jgi:hypothetical protein
MTRVDRRLESKLIHMKRHSAHGLLVLERKREMQRQAAQVEPGGRGEEEIGSDFVAAERERASDSRQHEGHRVGEDQALGAPRRLHLGGSLTLGGPYFFGRKIGKGGAGFEPAPGGCATADAVDGRLRSADGLGDFRLSPASFLEGKNCVLGAHGR